jgi:hypothetical protein
MQQANDLSIQLGNPCPVIRSVQQPFEPFANLFLAEGIAELVKQGGSGRQIRRLKVPNDHPAFVLSAPAPAKVGGAGGA